MSDKEVTASARTDRPDRKIKVVMVMFENQSFLRFHGALSAVHPGMRGIDPDNLRYCEDLDGNRYYQLPVTERLPKFGPEHSMADSMLQMALGRMDGFVQDFQRHYPECTPQDMQDIMSYFPLDSLPFDHTIGRLCKVFDNWHADVPGPTWPNRFFSLAGSSFGRVNMTAGARHRAEWVNMEQPTLFDRLNEAGVDWKCFYGDVPVSLVIKHHRRAENASHYYKMDEFWKACQGPASEFPDFTYIEPTWYGENGDSDLWPADPMLGQKFKARIYEALRQSEVWDDVVIIYTYDEHGGYYDDMYPPAAVPPDNHFGEWSFNQYGLRIPTLVISPLVEGGLDQTLYSHGSILKTLQELWGLGELGERVRASNSLMPLLTRCDEPRGDFPLTVAVPESNLPPISDDSKDKQSKSFMGDLTESATLLLAEIARTNGPEMLAGWSRLVMWYRRRVLRKHLAAPAAKEMATARYMRVVAAVPKFTDRARKDVTPGTMRNRVYRLRRRK